MQINPITILSSVIAKRNRIKVQEHMDHAALCKTCSRALVTAGSKCPQCDTRALPKRRKK